MRHVALNATFLDPGRSGGPETYLRGLAPALARERPGTRFTVLTTRRGARALVADGWRDFADVVALPVDDGERGRRLAGELVLTADAASRRGADVLHSLTNFGPPVARAAKVVTLHDVTFLHTRTFGLLSSAVMGTLILQAAHTADALIAVSQTARDDIARTLRVPADRITVVRHGAGNAAVPAAAPPPLDLPPGARVVACIAALRPHKNQALLIRALPHLPDDVVVVLAGAQEPYADAVRALAAELGVSDRVRMLGYLGAAELEGIYALAGCVALPTRAEGFGLPVLEALARGVPLACSDLPELREVGGSLPRFFDPDDPRAAAAAIAKVLDEPFDAVAAKQHAARFTWAAAAEATLAVYERALAR